IDRGWCTGDRRKRAKRHHASEIADWALAERNAGQLFVSVPIVLLLAGGDRLGFRHGKEPTTLRQLLRTVAIAEETVIADPLKIAGWDMNEKSPDELLGADCHRLLPATATIVLPAEADSATVDVEDAVVGNGDAMRIAADIVEDLFRSRKGRLGVDDPIRLAERRQVPLEGALFLQLGQGGEKLQLPGGIGLLQSLDE